MIRAIFSVFWMAALALMPAHAATITSSYVGASRGNDNIAGDKLGPINDLLAAGAYPIAELYLGKLENGGGGESGAIDMRAFDLVSYSKPDGTFTFHLPDDFVLTHYTVKAGNGFAVFVMDVLVNDGSVVFNSSFTKSGLSHLSFYGKQMSGISQVPVPAAAALFLVGFGMFSLRRKIAACDTL